MVPIYFLTVMSVGCCVGFSLVVVSRGCGPVTVRGLFTAVASAVTEHGLSGARASAAVAPGL